MPSITLNFTQAQADRIQAALDSEAERVYDDGFDELGNPIVDAVGRAPTFKEFLRNATANLVKRHEREEAKRALPEPDDVDIT